MFLITGTSLSFPYDLENHAKSVGKLTAHGPYNLVKLTALVRLKRILYNLALKRLCFFSLWLYFKIQ